MPNLHNGQSSLGNVGSDVRGTSLVFSTLKLLLIKLLIKLTKVHLPVEGFGSAKNKIIIIKKQHNTVNAQTNTVILTS